MRSLVCGLFMLAIVIAPTASAQQQVDLELVLLADASSSIDDAEILFQREGYAQAITHPAVLKAITSGLLQRIAITYVEWGDATAQEVVVPWTVIDGQAAAASFAARLLAQPRRAYGRNAIGSALREARGLIGSNEIEGLRRVIDLSADSANSWNGPPIETERQAAVAEGITINGLAVLCRASPCSGRPIGYDLEAAFSRRIIAGPGSFVVTVDAETSFTEAIRRKLVLEIASNSETAPAPGIE